MDDVLAKKKPQVEARYRQQTQLPVEVPVGLAIPADPKAALALGMRIGRTSGYGDGLVDGTELGLDVVLETMDTLMRMPVFAWGGPVPTC